MSSTCWPIANKSDTYKHKLAVINAEYTVRKRIHELNDGWVPDWSSESQQKCYVYVHKEVLKRNFYYYSKYVPNWMYLKSDELTKQLIAELPDELSIILNQ